MAEPGVKLGLSSPSYAWVVVEYTFLRLMMFQAVAEQGGTAATESALHLHSRGCWMLGVMNSVPEGALHPQRIGPRFDRCAVYID